ncbi:uncharacterized protein [Ptychodera flava]|uniref:uncharacterized protein n=1 Tax=Ptychodera flava TaxID=63121 RepID=UPI00396A65A0
MYKAGIRMAIARKYSPRDIQKDIIEDESDEEPELMALKEDSPISSPLPTQDLFLTQPSHTVHKPRHSSHHIHKPRQIHKSKIRETKSDIVIRGLRDSSTVSRDTVPIVIPTASKDEEEITADDTNSNISRILEIGERLQTDKRPHTAHVTFQDQKELGDELIRKYRSCPTTPSDWHSKESWFEDYQEKLIKRNQMLKAQRQQRVESAHQKRRLLELRQRERRRALLGHDTCGEGYHSDTTGVDRDLMTKSDSSLNTLKRRAQSAGFMNAPTSVSTTLNRPQSAFAKFKEDEDLAANLPFRVRLNKQPTRIKVNESEVFEHLPGNGKQLILKKPPPSKSVPSKCRRYVLVSHTPAAPPIPKPTALEEHLLPNRFPRDLKRWNEFEDYVKSRVSEDPHMMFSGVDDFMSSAWK